MGEVWYIGSMAQNYKVVLYREVYTTYEVEAGSKEEASDIVLRGEFPQLVDPDEVTVRESEIIDCWEAGEVAKGKYGLT